MPPKRRKAKAKAEHRRTQAEVDAERWVVYDARSRAPNPNRPPTQAFRRGSLAFWAQWDEGAQQNFLDLEGRLSWLRGEEEKKVQEKRQAITAAEKLHRGRRNDMKWEIYMSEQHDAAVCCRAQGNLAMELSRVAIEMAERLTGMVNNRDPVQVIHQTTIQHAWNEPHVHRQRALDTNDEALIYQRRANEPDIIWPRADAALKIYDDWVDQTTHRQIRFQNGQPGDPANPWTGWTGAWMIHGGGMSTAGLWVLLDEHLEVQDRAVRKDTYLSRFDWGTITRWYGDPRDITNRVVLEIKSHTKMDAPTAVCDRPDANGANAKVNVPAIRATGVDNDQMLYSMTLAYAPFKTLKELIDEHDWHKRDVPEAFCWRVFHSLAECGLAMEHGHACVDQPDLPDHEQIIHRDLKPQNIFLAELTLGFFESYPTPQLGDYGISLITTETDPLNPDMYCDGMGTEGFIAPEHNAYVDLSSNNGNLPGKVDRFKLTSKTNVYGIGAIMYALTKLDQRPKQPTFLGDGSQDLLDPEGINYSDKLIKLIKGCVSFDPANRPTFERILERINDQMEADELVEDARDRPTAEDGLLIDGEKEFLWYLPRDRYAVGLRWMALPGDLSRME